MKIFRPILPVFVLVAVCATGGVWVVSESIRPVQIAQAQSAAQSGGNREFHAQLQAFRASLFGLVGVFAAGMTVMLGLLWKTLTGRISALDFVFLAPVAVSAVLTVGAAIAAIV